jgi:hypothetical protein
MSSAAAPTPHVPACNIPATLESCTTSLHLIVRTQYCKLHKKETLETHTNINTFPYMETVRIHLSAQIELKLLASEITPTPNDTQKQLLSLTFRNMHD